MNGSRMFAGSCFVYKRVSREIVLYPELPGAMTCFSPGISISLGVGPLLKYKYVRGSGPLGERAIPFIARDSGAELSGSNGFFFFLLLLFLACNNFAICHRQRARISSIHCVGFSGPCP